MSTAATTDATSGSDATSGTTDQQAATTPEDQTPATDDGLGEAGREALRRERAATRDASRRAQAAEQELERLRAATQSETERALGEARREGATERDTYWAGIVRQNEVRAALREAGIKNTATLDLVAGSNVFTDLGVNAQSGAVDGLADVIARLRKESPEFFGAQQGSADGGVRGQAAGGASMNDLMRQAVGLA